MDCRESMVGNVRRAVCMIVGMCCVRVKRWPWCACVCGCDVCVRHDFV